MARDGNNIDKWYKEYLKGLKEPVGARGWQPDEAAQDWVNNAIEKIFGKGTATPTAYTMGSRGVALPPATGGYQTNPLGNALVASPWSSSMQPGAVGSWIPTAPQPGINSGSFMYEPQPVGSWEPQAEMGDYFKKDGVLYANEPLRRDWSTNLYYGENSGQLYGQRWNQDKGVYEYTYTGTERNKYGQPAETMTPYGQTMRRMGFAHFGGPDVLIDPNDPSKGGKSYSRQEYRNPNKGAFNSARYSRRAKRINPNKGEEGWGPENAASGTGIGWSW